VDVDKGHVTLSGTVSSWDEAEQAEMLASETEGVNSLTDNLVMSYPKERSDDAIQKDVTAALSRDIYLTGFPVESSVDNGVVTLSGKVGSAYEKQRAADDVRWIWNVKNIKNDLDVVWWDNAGARTRMPIPSDSRLAKAVNDELTQDLRLEPSKVEVSAHSGTVTLHGSVPTFYQKRIAGQDAKDVVGTAWVTNLLSVTEQNRSDKAILGDVRYDLDTDFALNLDLIGVTVKNGVVTMTGDVHDFWEKSHAYDIVSRIRGVKKVVNDIEVNYDALYTDSAIRDRVVARLQANADTRFVADAIDVTVHDGKVTLGGTVDFWSEYDTAEEIAYETDGVWAVDNQLEVRNYDYNWSDFSYPWPTDYALDTYYPPYVYLMWWS
jgi:osmotically-inducible protein OsmY